MVVIRNCFNTVHPLLGITILSENYSNPLSGLLLCVEVVDCMRQIRWIRRGVNQIVGIHILRKPGGLPCNTQFCIVILNNYASSIHQCSSPKLLLHKINLLIVITGLLILRINGFIPLLQFKDSVMNNATQKQPKTDYYLFWTKAWFRRICCF